MKLIVIRAMATVASLAMLGGAFLSFLFFFLSAAPPPCALPSRLYEASQILLLASLLIGMTWTAILAQFPNGRSLVAALLLTALPLALYGVMASADARAQRQCKAETLQQAAARCRIDTAVYRRGRDEFGNPIFALVAPGEIDQAWSCLNRWAMHNGSISVTVDPSVIRYRERARTRQGTS